MLVPEEPSAYTELTRGRQAPLFPWLTVRRNVEFGCPRSIEVLTAPAFTALKRKVFKLIREEAMRALADA